MNKLGIAVSVVTVLVLSALVIGGGMFAAEVGPFAPPTPTPTPRPEPTPVPRPLPNVDLRSYAPRFEAAMSNKIDVVQIQIERGEGENINLFMLQLYIDFDDVNPNEVSFTDNELKRFNDLYKTLARETDADHMMIIWIRLDLTGDHIIYKSTFCDARAYVAGVNPQCIGSQVNTPVKFAMPLHN